MTSRSVQEVEHPDRDECARVARDFPRVIDEWVHAGADQAETSARMERAQEIVVRAGGVPICTYDGMKKPDGTPAGPRGNLPPEKWRWQPWDEHTTSERVLDETDSRLNGATKNLCNKIDVCVFAASEYKLTVNTEVLSHIRVALDDGTDVSPERVHEAKVAVSQLAVQLAAPPVQRRLRNRKTEDDPEALRAAIGDLKAKWLSSKETAEYTGLDIASLKTYRNDADRHTLDGIEYKRDKQGRVSRGEDQDVEYLKSSLKPAKQR